MRAAPSSPPQYGTPYTLVICSQARSMQHWMINSAMSVRRSLTAISGKRPVRSASATENTATFWNCRKASTCALRIIRRQPLGAGCEFAGKSRPRGRLIEGLRVDQLVEQQRKIRNLARQKTADRADLDQTIQRRGLLFQQREVGRAGADRIEHAQHSLHHGGRRWPHCRRLQQTLEDDVQPPASRLIESAVRSRMAISFQQRRDRRRFGGRKSAVGEFLRDVDVLGVEPTQRRLAVSALRIRARRTTALRIGAPRCRGRSRCGRAPSSQSGTPY